MFWKQWHLSYEPICLSFKSDTNIPAPLNRALITILYKVLRFVRKLSYKTNAFQVKARQNLPPSNLTCVASS